MKKRQDKQISVRRPGRERRNDGKRVPPAWYGRDDVFPDDPADRVLLAVSRETGEEIELLGPARRLPEDGQKLVCQQMAAAREWLAERRKMLQLIKGEL